jgi:hypothetical protein
MQASGKRGESQGKGGSVVAHGGCVAPAHGFYVRCNCKPV